MHGLGNDFMVIDAINQQINMTPLEIASLAKRNTGVGFDQCLLVEKSDQPDVDFFYRIFNSNGQEVSQCGNGARCLARFAQHYGLTDNSLITVATTTTLMQLHINDNETVTVNMGQPKFEPQDIPLNVQQQDITYTLPLANDHHAIVYAVSMGNPHAVLVVPDVTTAPISDIGQQISEHILFPEQTNAGFMQIINPSHIHLRVYERGCGETLACGSGAVAAVAIGRKYHQLAEKVTVSLPGGDLLIEWPLISGPIFLTGAATFVYEGKLFNL